MLAIFIFFISSNEKQVRTLDKPNIYLVLSKLLNPEHDRIECFVVGLQ